MTITRTDHQDHSEVAVLDEKGNKIHCYVFGDFREAKAFMQGWLCCQSVINGLVQRLPQSYDLQKAP